MFKAGDTLAVIKSFRAGRRIFRIGDWAWVTATNRTHGTSVKADQIMIGKRQDHIGQGQLFLIADIADKFKIEL